MIRATVFKIEGKGNVRFPKGQDLEQPHVDDVCSDDQVDRLTIFTCYNEAYWDAAAYRV
jgi:hypothetical protein